MRNLYTTIILAMLLFLTQGCRFVAESLDYQNGLSDYEAGKIVRTVLLSQHTIADAALLSASGYRRMGPSSDLYPNERYSCQDGGYIRFTFDEDGYSLTFESGDLIHLNYDTCRYHNYDDSTWLLNGPVDLTWYQDMEDSVNRVIELGITYHDAWLQNSYATAYLDGEIGLHYDEDYTSDRLQLVLTSDELRVRANNATQSNTFENIVLDFSMNMSDYRYRYTYHGTLFNAYLGRLTFTTLSPIQGNRDDNPYRGELKITNAHMTLRVIPVDTYYVDIIVQNHYDTFENRTIHTTWRDIGL